VSATILDGKAVQREIFGDPRARVREIFEDLRARVAAQTTRARLEAVVDELNADPACPGFIVQLPLPGHLDAGPVLERVDLATDAGGLHPVNLGRLLLGEPGPRAESVR
jgi:5,10-methylene-tetrahydrofolate dehydrogenase/methenyl tetrahydrofolate cyclohydrolase